MVEGRWRPAAGLVTIFADIVGRKVGRGLASGAGSIVTGYAAASHTAMIECRRRPGTGRVARSAFGGGRDMRIGLAWRLCAVVTA